MTDTDDSANIIIDFSHKITLIRYLGNTMTPVSLKMRAEVFPSDTAVEIDFDVTFSKIKFWFESVISRSIVFCRRNATAMEMLLNDAGKPRVINHLMVTPFEPTDEHLAVLFQSKMTAFSQGTMEFGCVRVEAADGGLVFTYVGDWREDLPAMDDWFPIKPYYFEIPWWQRDDASTLDVITTDADISQLPSWAYSLDFIEKAIRPNKTTSQPEDIVIRGAFRPKIISGGKEED
jgi:hypothetical protein